MKRTLTIVASLILLSSAGYAAEQLKAPFEIKWYKEHYPFMRYGGRIFAFQTEFLFPDGFRPLDKKKLTDYQFWVSNFPLWHADKGVGSLARGLVLDSSKISRSVHLPWRTTRFYDCVIPLQMVAEYMVYKKHPFDLTYLSKTSEPLTYRKFLDSKITYDALGNVYFNPAEKRKPSDSLFSAFIDLVACNTTYASLERNCRPVPDSLIRPGDLLVGRDSSGFKGKVYIIMLVVANEAGEKQFIVATGCEDGCDLYIPLFNDDRNYPWLTLSQLRGLVTQPVVGIFRPNVPGESR